MNAIQIERVHFDSHGESVVGALYRAAGHERGPAVVLTGPLTSVKEQATGNYARAFAERGFTSLAFDHRFFGESGGKPRQYESPPKKIEDVRAALAYLAARPEVDPERIVAVGVCAGGGYMAGAVAAEPRFAAFGAIAGFFHDAKMQRQWMPDGGFETALGEAQAARARYEASGVAEIIPAVGRGPGPVAMPLAEAFEYYGTARGALGGYRNEFAVLSRQDTLVYDAQSAAPRITAPTIVVHSEHALAPALARAFHAGLQAPKDLRWLESKGQIDFYDDPALIARAADAVVAFVRAQSAFANGDPAPR